MDAMTLRESPIAHIFFQGCPEDTRRELLERLPVREGDVLSEDLLQRAVQAAKAFDRRLEIRVGRAASREEYLKIPQQVRDKYGISPPACDNGVNVAIYNPELLPKRIRVEAAAQESMSVEKVTPTGAGEGGVVTVAVIVGKDGSVIEASAVSGPGAARDSAVGAVRQWKYRPTLLNGWAVEVQTTVEVAVGRG